jgi:gamma-glutamyltranspeptidase/glutathione hydrolase
MPLGRLLFLWPAIGFASPNTAAEAAEATPSIDPRGMVATVHPLATRAGVEALRQGGNAVDAAVAAALTLGVVDGHNSGIGGGCFVLMRAADGRVFAIDGRETAPGLAHRDLFVRSGPEASKTGPLASATPGALAAYALAVQQCGRLPLAALLSPAAQIAEEGFPIDRVYARSLAATAVALGRFPASREALLKPGGQPYTEGELLRQEDLAATYRAIAREGIGWFYEGPFAAATDRWMSAQGGLLRREDFVSYRARLRTPLETRYRQLTVIGFPPPSSGGIHVAQILGMLEPFDVAQLADRNPGQLLHLVAECMKLAFADRAYWLGDADFAQVPRGLIDNEYLRSQSKRVHPDRAQTVREHAVPPRATVDLFGQHTTHVAAADAEGNWVAITATINTTFGSKVVIPGTGVILNNEMDDFSIQPGVPNAFGLLGAEANAIAPGKRPLSSMSPTIILKDGQPILTLGAAGGPTIISQVALTILRHLDLELPLAEAVAAPRLHHQWSPDELLVEEAMPPLLVAALKDRGHDVRSHSTFGVTQAVAADPRGLLGVHDPRVPGLAAGPSR